MNKTKMDNGLENHWKNMSCGHVSLCIWWYMYFWNTVAREDLCEEVALKLKMEGASHEEMWVQSILGARSKLIVRIMGPNASLPYNRITHPFYLPGNFEVHSHCG